MTRYSDQQLRAQLKPYSENAFVAFFQRIWRGWLSIWYGFADKHPKLSNLIYMVFFFIVFSEGVTIWQFIVMTFLPYAFAGLNNGPWGWPNVPVSVAGGQPYMIFGDVQGLGYFIAFELAVFTAQCINFPLQRNITYRSHGNPWYQAMWYFIGWVLVSVFVNAIWGICNVFFVHWGWPDVVTGLIKTVLTGGVSMVIFFFIFLVIFPDNNKVLKKAKAKYEKLLAANAPAEKLAKAEKAYRIAQDKADRSNSEKDYRQALSLCNAKILKYFAATREKEDAIAERKRAERILKGTLAAKEDPKLLEGKTRVTNLTAVLVLFTLSSILLALACISVAVAIFCVLPEVWWAGLVLCLVALGTLILLFPFRTAIAKRREAEPAWQGLAADADAYDRFLAKKVDIFARAEKAEEIACTRCEEAFGAACASIGLRDEKYAAYHAVMDRLGLPTK